MLKTIRKSYKNITRHTIRREKKKLKITKKFTGKKINKKLKIEDRNYMKNIKKNIIVIYAIHSLYPHISLKFINKRKNISKNFKNSICNNKMDKNNDFYLIKFVL